MKDVAFRNLYRTSRWMVHYFGEDAGLLDFDKLDDEEVQNAIREMAKYSKLMVIEFDRDKR